MKAHRWVLNRFSVSALLILVTAPAVLADDWPQWRGPNRDGVWNETGLVEKFDSPQLKLRWRVPISSGYSGPTVAAGRVYVTDRIAQPKERERVHCFDAKTGKPLWTHAYDCVYRNISYPAGPRAAVTINQGRAYALGAMGHFFCFDAATGSVLWEKDLNAGYQIRMPIWGIAAAPLVEGDLVIVQIGGEDNACLVAFDTQSGQERWRALPDQASYSAPIVVEQAGHRVLVCWTGGHVAGLDPQSGDIYWQHPFPPAQMVLAIATPVIDQGRLFVTAFYDGSLLLKLNANELAVEQVWRRKGENELKTDSLHSIISTPLIQGDYIYGVDSYGELRCLDVKTGDRVWEDLTAVPKARWSNIHFVRNAEKIWMFTERGELVISRLSPQGFEENSRAKLLEPTLDQLPQRSGRQQPGVCWSHPAFADRHVFARNDKELVCASLEAK